MSSPKIEFKKVARECGANDRRRAEGKSLFYDYEVYIDGEHRCNFDSRIGSKGYELTWNTPGYHYPVAREYDRQTHVQRVKIDYSNKDKFEVVILACLDEGLIPTVEQCKKHVIDQLLEKLDEEFQQRQRARAHRLAEKSEEMLDLLERAVIEGTSRRLDRDITAIRTYVGPFEVEKKFANYKEMLAYLVQTNMISEDHAKVILPGLCQ